MRLSETVRYLQAARELSADHMCWGHPCSESSGESGASSKAREASTKANTANTAEDHQAAAKANKAAADAHYAAGWKQREAGNGAASRAHVAQGMMHDAREKYHKDQANNLARLSTSPGTGGPSLLDRLFRRSK